MAPGTSCFSCPVSTGMSAHANPPSLSMQACLGRRAGVLPPSRAAVTGVWNAFQLAYAMAGLCIHMVTGCLSTISCCRIRLHLDCLACPSCECAGCSLYSFGPSRKGLYGGNTLCARVKLHFHMAQKHPLAAAHSPGWSLLLHAEALGTP